MTHTPTPKEYNTGNSTPLPWEVEPGFDEVCNDGTRIPTWNIMAPKGWMESNGTFSKCSVVPELESEGDARLIVTAVNSRAQLVEALKRTLSWLSSYPGGGALDCYEQARAALAAAGEEV